jgi:KDO2-lipid IV(A) lauroyltransferase
MVGDIPVIFAMMHKEKRGYYRSRISLLSDHSAQRHEGEITLAYIRILEQSIRENPSMWLWSHRRWKHAWNEKYRQNWIDDQPPIATTF